MIEWKQEYAVGIDILDNQHKKLFSIAKDKLIGKQKNQESS